MNSPMQKERSYLWSSNHAARATRGIAQGNWEANGISIDSRDLLPGDLFIALKGPNHDGHDHVSAALSGDAVAAMVEHLPKVPDVGPLLIVPNSIGGLYDLARAARLRSDARIIAITGSVGKTGMKGLIYNALSSVGSVSCSLGNLNNHIGAPLSLARLPIDAKFGVFELGMNRPGEIKTLSNMIRPHIAVITNVEEVHTEFFEHTDGVAKAKAEIFEGLETGGTVILNFDNKYFEYLNGLARKNNAKNIISFGKQVNADARLLNWLPDKSGGTVEAKIFGVNCKYHLQLRGEHWAINSVAALAAAVVAGVPLALATNGVSSQRAISGRGNVVKCTCRNGYFTLIDESYNASPISMKAAIRSLQEYAPIGQGRRIVVLGDMLELGSNASKLHESLVNEIIRYDISFVFTVGSLMANLHKALPKNIRGSHTSNSSEMVHVLHEIINEHDVVLIKGSNGSKMKVLVDAFIESPVLIGTK